MDTAVKLQGPQRASEREGAIPRMVLECVTELETGDKVSTAHGGKHAVGIVDDSAMPTIEGKLVAVMVSPAGLIERQSVGLLL